MADIQKYGVTESGFVRMRLPEIRTAIQQDLKSRLLALGITEDPSYGPDSVIGLLIDTFAERETAMWEMCSWLWGAMYPNTASGVNLDNAAAYTGVKRLPEQAPAGMVTFYGAEGTVIPVGTTVQPANSSEVWQTSAEGVISASRMAEATIEPTAQPNGVYTVTLDGTSYTYRAPAVTDRERVVQGLVGAIPPQLYDVYSNGMSIRVRPTARLISSITVSGNIGIREIGSPIPVTADGLRSDVAAGGMTVLNNQIQGVTHIKNLGPIFGGSPVESDGDLRERYQIGVFRTGAATYPSLKPNMLQRVPGVTLCRVFENDTDATDAFGNLPHSVRYVVQGGEDQAIATEIWTRKAAGIDTNGAVSVQIDAGFGEHQIRFDRPRYRFVWLKIVVTLRPGTDKTFFNIGEIRQLVAVSAGRFDIGQAASAQSLLCGVYRMPQVEDAEVTWAITDNTSTPPGDGDYKTGTIPSGPTDLLEFDLSRIAVNVRD